MFEGIYDVCTNLTSLTNIPMTFNEKPNSNMGMLTFISDVIQIAISSIVKTFKCYSLKQL